jgi:hypothetical protein
MPDELYSALLRLRSKGFQIASTYAAARQERVVAPGDAVEIIEEDVEHALAVVKLHKRSTEALFAYVGGSEEATQEKLALGHIAATSRATPSTVAAALGISVKAATGLCTTLSIEGLVEKVSERSGGRGRPRIFYTIPPIVI